MTTTWKIPHPGTGELIEVESFEKAMETWFEGFNLPILFIDGKPEAFEVSYARVKAWTGDWILEALNKKA